MPIHDFYCSADKGGCGTIIQDEYISAANVSSGTYPACPSCQKELRIAFGNWAKVTGRVDGYTPVTLGGVCYETKAELDAFLAKQRRETGEDIELTGDSVRQRAARLEENAQMQLNRIANCSHRGADWQQRMAQEVENTMGRAAQQMRRGYHATN